MTHWIVPLSLGQLRRRQRVTLLGALQVTIHADVLAHGGTGPLRVLGTALGYCASLLRDVPIDPEGDAADAARVILGDELRRSFDALRTHGGALIVQRLLLPGGPTEEVQLARTLLLLAAAAPELGWDGTRLSAALQNLELAEARCAAASVIAPTVTNEVAQRARQATRFADALLRQLWGLAQGLAAPGDDAALLRAQRLVRPLWEATLAPEQVPPQAEPLEGTFGTSPDAAEASLPQREPRIAKTRPERRPC